MFEDTVDCLVVDLKLPLPIVTETADVPTADEANEAKSPDDEACYGCDDAEASPTLGFAANDEPSTPLASSPPFIPIETNTCDWRSAFLVNCQSRPC